VLGVVEDVDLAGDDLGGDETGVLGHVPGPVDLALVVDLLDNLDLGLEAPKAAVLALLLVVLLGVDAGRVGGDPDGGNEEVVLVPLGGVCPQDEPVGGVVLAGELLDVGQPLHREGGPLQRMRHHHVVQERRVLLPDLVLLIYQLLLWHLSSFSLLIISSSSSSSSSYVILLAV